MLVYHFATAVFSRHRPVQDAATSVESRQVVAKGQLAGNERASQQNAAL